MLSVLTFLAAPIFAESSLTISPSAVQAALGSARLLQKQTYTSEAHHITVRLPMNWISTEHGASGAILTAHNPTFDTVHGHHYRAQLNLFVEALGQNVEEAQYVDNALLHMEDTFKDFTTVSRYKTVINGKKGTVLEHTFSENGRSMHLLQLIMFNDQQAYLFTALTPDAVFHNYQQEFKRVFQSIQFKG